MRYKVKPIRTRYWRPGEDYSSIIVNALYGKLRDGDIVAISEKALSVSQGNLVDESGVEPRSLAKFLAKFWMRIVWGYFLGPLCRLSPHNIRNLRNYPIEEGAKHKQVTLERAGFFLSLKPFSEGGIDASNVPFSLVCLPLPNPDEVARKIRDEITKKLKKKVSTIIVDTDRTFSMRNLHFSTRKSSVKGLINVNGFFTYLFGRTFRLKGRATPLAIVGLNLCAEEALELADLADRAFGHGAGRNIWEMAEKFGVDLTEVTWEMLRSVKHEPIVIFRGSEAKVENFLRDNVRRGSF